MLDPSVTNGSSQDASVSATNDPSADLLLLLGDLAEVVRTRGVHQTHLILRSLGEPLPNVIACGSGELEQELQETNARVGNNTRLALLADAIEDQMEGTIPPIHAVIGLTRIAFSRLVPYSLAAARALAEAGCSQWEGRVELWSHLLNVANTQAQFPSSVMVLARSLAPTTDLPPPIEAQFEHSSTDILSKLESSLVLLGAIVDTVREVTDHKIAFLISID